MHKIKYNNFGLFVIARLAQSVERGTFNPEVKGSSPLSGEHFFVSLIFKMFKFYIHALKKNELCIDKILPKQK